MTTSLVRSESNSHRRVSEGKFSSLLVSIGNWLDALDRDYSAGRAPGLAFSEIVAVSRFEEIELAAWRDDLGVVEDEDVGSGDHFEAIALNDDCRVLVDADAEQIGILFDNLEHVELAISHENVLIDRNVFQEPKRFEMVTDHLLIAFRIASHHKGSQDRGAGGRATDNSTTIKQGLKLTMCERVEIRIGQSPLSPALKENAAGLSDRSDEFFGVGGLAVACMQKGNVAHACFFELLQAWPVLIVLVRISCRRYNHEPRVFASGEFNESLENRGIMHVSADNQ